MVYENSVKNSFSNVRDMRQNSSKPVNQKNLVEVNRKVTQTENENFVHKNNLAVAWENKSWYRDMPNKSTNATIDCARLWYTPYAADNNELLNIAYLFAYTFKHEY